MNLKRKRNRNIGMITVFLMIAAGLFILSVAQGAASIAPARVVEALTAPQPTTTDQIIWNIRLPRTLTGIFVGMNLALAGAILQAIMRNPLADPPSWAAVPRQSWTGIRPPHRAVPRWRARGLRQPSALGCGAAPPCYKPKMRGK